MGDSTRRGGKNTRETYVRLPWSVFWEFRGSVLRESPSLGRVGNELASFRGGAVPSANPLSPLPEEPPLGESGFQARREGLGLRNNPILITEKQIGRAHV